MPNRPTDPEASDTTTAAEVPTPGERYLRLESATVYVRDPDLSLRFYVERLGFREAFDTVLPSGARIIAVSPPNGDANLILVTPAPESREFALIGRAMQLAFMTEDIEATY